VDQDTYKHFVHCVKTGDLASKVLWWKAEADALEVWNNWMERSDYFEFSPLDEIAFVKNGQDVIGFLEFSDLRAPLDAQKVADLARPFPIDCIIDANKPVIDAVRAFGTSSEPFLFVRTEGVVNRWLPYTDLLSPRFRLCLFALLVAVEGAALAAILTSARDVVKLMSNDTHSKALHRYNRHHFEMDEDGEPYPRRLIECTLFSDKMTLLRQWSKTANLASVQSRFFTMANDVRNAVAHAGDDSDSLPLLDRTEINAFLDWAETVQTDLWETARLIDEEQLQKAFRLFSVEDA